MENAAVVTVQRSRCVRVRNRNVRCDRCVAACPMGAIEVRGSEPVVADGCIGCGACVAACPTEALGIPGFGPEEVLGLVLKAARANGGTAVIASASDVAAVAEDADLRKVAAVPGLSMVDESLFVGLAANGVSQVTLVQRDGGNDDEEALASAGQLLGILGCELDVKVSAKFPQSIKRDGVESDCPITLGEAPMKESEPLPVECTAALTGIPTPAQNAPALHARKDGVIPNLPSFKRDMLLDGLWALSQKCEVQGDALVCGRLWSTVKIDPSGCIGCKACARFCPTGALTPVMDDGKIVAVEFYAGDCVRCGICEGSCPRHLVKLEEGADLRDVVDGVSRRLEIRQPAYVPGKPESTTEAMRLRMNCKNVYTR